MINYLLFRNKYEEVWPNWHDRVTKNWHKEDLGSLVVAALQGSDFTLCGPSLWGARKQLRGLVRG